MAGRAGRRAVLALIVALVWFAGRVYRNAVLRMGAKIRLREALSR